MGTIVTLTRCTHRDLPVTSFWAVDPPAAATAPDGAFAWTLRTSAWILPAGFEVALSNGGERRIYGSADQPVELVEAGDWPAILTAGGDHITLSPAPAAREESAMGASPTSPTPHRCAATDSHTLLSAAAEMPAAERLPYLNGVVEDLRYQLRDAEEMLAQAQDEIVPLAWEQVQLFTVLRFHPEPGVTSYGTVTHVNASGRKFNLYIPGEGTYTYLWDASAPYYFQVDQEATAAARVPDAPR